MKQAFINAASLPHRTSQRNATCSRWRMKNDSQAPPESRVAPYYPVKGRFEAPHLNFFTCEVELMNKIGLTQSEVELDFTTAAEILRKAAAQRTQDEGDFNNLFTAPTTDPTAQEPADVYFPMWRRDEAPIIEIQEARDSSPGRVMISVGAVEATPPEEEGPEMPASEPGFWKTPGTRSARDIVDAKYGVGVRNIAPVIEFGDVEYSVSLEMKTILGECEADLYPSESRFYAPEIRMKKPAGEWDHTGYVEVSSVEVQLPLMKAERMKH